MEELFLCCLSPPVLGVSVWVLEGVCVGLRGRGCTLWLVLVLFTPSFFCCSCLTFYDNRLATSASAWLYIIPL